MVSFRKIVNENKGITLIALVITVIILLILAGITIGALSGNNGIVKETKRAKEETEISKEKEIIEISTVQAMGENEEANIEKTELEKCLDQNAGKGNTEVIDEENLLLVKFIASNRYYKIDEEGTATEHVVTDRTGIKVGDYIDYQPAKNADGTVKIYSKDNLVKDIAGSTSNTEDIKQDDLKWQVLRIYKDGKMDLIGTPTSQNIYFTSGMGYNNGVNIMHDICEKLYSRPGITARSVKLEDMESWLTPDGKKAKSDYINRCVAGITTENTNAEKANIANNTVTYKKALSYYPSLYERENGAGINTENVLKNGMKDTDKVADLKDLAGQKVVKQAENLTVTQTAYSISIDSTNYGEGVKVLSNRTWYWVASRDVQCNSMNCDFELRAAAGQTNRGIMLGSNGGVSFNHGYCIRPVVTLGSKVQVEVSSTASSSTGTPHKITEY